MIRNFIKQLKKLLKIKNVGENLNIIQIIHFKELILLQNKYNKNKKKEKDKYNNHKYNNCKDKDKGDYQ